MNIVKQANVKIIFIAMLCCYCFKGSAQFPVDLDSKLTHYFEKIPVLKPTNEIIAFLKSDTVNYETGYYSDSVTHNLLEFDTYAYQFQKDTTYTHIFYRDDTPVYIKDSANYDLSLIGAD